MSVTIRYGEICRAAAVLDLGSALSFKSLLAVWLCLSQLISKTFSHFFSRT